MPPTCSASGVETFIGGSMKAARRALATCLYGETEFSGSFNESYSEILQPVVFMSGAAVTGGVCPITWPTQS